MPPKRQHRRPKHKKRSRKLTNRRPRHNTRSQKLIYRGTRHKTRSRKRRNSSLSLSSIREAAWYPRTPSLTTSLLWLPRCEPKKLFAPERNCRSQDQWQAPSWVRKFKAFFEKWCTASMNAIGFQSETRSSLPASIALVPASPLSTERAKYTPGIGAGESCSSSKGPPGLLRSEERRVEKECRSRWSPYH